MADFSLIDLIKEGVQSRPPDLWPAFDGTMLDRSKFMTSSEAGNCERQIWFDKNEPVTRKPNSHEWGFWERGHNVEAWVVAQLIASAGAVKYTHLGKDQRSFYSGRQSGTPDGLAYPSGGEWNVEIKSIDPRTNTKNLPKPNNILQCMQNMDLVSECLDTDIMGSKLVYVNASDYTKMYEWTVFPDGDTVSSKGVITEHTGLTLKDLEAKAHKIFDAKSAEEMKPEGIYNGGCTYCKHTSRCSGVVAMKKEEAKANAEINKVAKGIFK